jgi:hypothetical protein
MGSYKHLFNLESKEYLEDFNDGLTSLKNKKKGDVFELLSKKSNIWLVKKPF